MITFDTATNRGLLKRYVKGNCLSTDEKPTVNIANGSVLIEIDTGKMYIFDEENQIWKEWE